MHNVVWGYAEILPYLHTQNMHRAEEFSVPPGSRGPVIWIRPAFEYLLITLLPKRLYIRQG